MMKTIRRWRRWLVAGCILLVGCMPISEMMSQPTPVVLPVITPTPTPSAHQHFLTAEEFFAQGQYELAATFYTFAIQTDPYLLRTYSRLGLAYESMGDLKSAVAVYSIAIQLAPYQPENYFLRGLAYQKQGLTALAVANFRRFLELSEDPIQRAIAENHLNELSQDEP